MIETDRLITPAPQSTQEEALERALRPKQLDEYIGQEKIRSQLQIFIEAARNRGEALDHVLLFGPPGIGQDHAGAYHRPGNGRESAADLGAGAGAARRSRGAADQS